MELEKNFQEEISAQVVTEDQVAKRMKESSEDRMLVTVKKDISCSSGTKEDGAGEETEEGEKVQLVGSEDLIESQESENSFARAVGITMSDKEADKEEENKIKQRLRDRGDKKAMELPTERKEAQNAFI
ncbi:hypothetical protein E2562_000235 [Oryza meyeriana var. granulata]|uniref:Uncharacterized protein n=1 Tax=Oryza meyeriana var. granulata TaxID=110450 RepID=A0A6G1CMP5_9ORYZ|nr:hypothetical protein E2562_000235 [Oryza meyeriana var. granulata]